LPEGRHDDHSGDRRHRPHHDLTGPVPLWWPEALELLSAELGEPITFQVAAERQFLQRLTGAGVPAGTAELLITREWAILAGENDYTTGTFQQITGRSPRGGRVPSRVPRGIHLMPARRPHPIPGGD
jgi:hypothetical protein